MGLGRLLRRVQRSFHRLRLRRTAKQRGDVTEIWENNIETSHHTPQSRVFDHQQSHPQKRHHLSTWFWPRRSMRKSTFNVDLQPNCDASTRAQSTGMKEQPASDTPEAVDMVDNMIALRKSELDSDGNPTIAGRERRMSAQQRRESLPQPRREWI